MQSTVLYCTVCTHDRLSQTTEDQLAKWGKFKIPEREIAGAVARDPSGDSAYSRYGN